MDWNLTKIKTGPRLTCGIYSIYGKPVPGAESHYEFCCPFPQNGHTLHALESSIFIGILCCLLHSSVLDLLTTLSQNLGPEGAQKVKILNLLLAIIQGKKKTILTSKLGITSYIFNDK